MHTNHPSTPHWYLWMLGVEPALQGQGLGSELLRSLTAKVDAAGELSYLETDRERCIGLYQGHGFQVMSDAVLPGVNVTVVHDLTGLTRTTTSDTAGAYVFVSLPIGSYTVTAELEGFQKAVRSGSMLVADGRLTADFALQVGGLTETIQVTSPGESVNTVSGEIARVVDREQVQNLALNGRNYMQLATLIPGAPLLDDNALNSRDARVVPPC